MASPAQLRLPPTGPPVEFPGEKIAQPDYLTEAIVATVHRERSLAKAVADAVGVHVREVYAVAHTSSPRPLKAWWIPSIVRETGSFAILDALEAQVGRVAFRLPSVNPHADEMQRQLARSVREFGEFLETNTDVLADGRLEPHEVPPMLGAIDTMLADLSAYREMVVRKAAQDGPSMAKAAIR